VFHIAGLGALFFGGAKSTKPP